MKLERQRITMYHEKIHGTDDDDIVIASTIFDDREELQAWVNELVKNHPIPDGYRWLSRTSEPDDSEANNA